MTCDPGMKMLVVQFHARYPHLTNEQLWERLSDAWRIGLAKIGVDEPFPMSVAEVAQVRPEVPA